MRPSAVGPTELKLARGDDHDPAGRELPGRACDDGRLAVHVRRRVAVEGSIESEIAEGSAHHVDAQGLGPFGRRRPVVLLDGRLALGVLGLGEDVVRCKGGTDQLPRTEGPENG
jgi:hypothetical protein